MSRQFQSGDLVRLAEEPWARLLSPEATQVEGIVAAKPRDGLVKMAWPDHQPPLPRHVYTDTLVLLERADA